MPSILDRRAETRGFRYRVSDPALGTSAVSSLRRPRRQQLLDRLASHPHERIHHGQVRLELERAGPVTPGAVLMETEHYPCGRELGRVEQFLATRGVAVLVRTHGLRDPQGPFPWTQRYRQLQLEFGQAL